MRSVSKAWPSRLLATVTTLALLVACVMGAYAHAAGHQPPQGAHTADLAISGDHAEHNLYAINAALSEPGHDGYQTGHSPDGCDTFCQMCHAGQAILAVAAVVALRAPSVPPIKPADAFGGATPGGPDRPPKAFLPA